MELDVDAYRMRIMFCKALEAEGVKVSTYQQAPLPAFPIFHNYQKLVSFEHYPNTLETIRSSFILGCYSLCPPNNEDTIRAIAKGIFKVYEHRKLLADEARKMKNIREPWEGPLYLT
jgi:hypothetical protein